MLTVFLGLLTACASAAQLGKPASLPAVRLAPLPLSAPALPATALPPAAVAPSVEIGPLAPPVLPAAAPGLAIPLGVIAPAEASRPLTIVDALRVMAEAGAAPAGGLDARLGDRAFDGAGAKPSGGSSEGGAPQVKGPPKLPPGARQVRVDEIKTKADLVRVVPENDGSRDLLERLKRQIDEMAPYRIYTYSDAVGRSFQAVDLSRKPQLIDHFPDQQSHEIKLIKKIQLWNQDLQIVIRDEGSGHKTPDIVLGGTVTELKSLFGPMEMLHKVLAKANFQVADHAHRHGLGRGAVAVDLTAYEKVPMAEVLAEVGKWRDVEPDNMIDKIYLFAGSDLKILLRQRDGKYRPAAPEKVPPAAQSRRPATSADIQVLQALLKQGRLYEVERRLLSLEGETQEDPHHPMAQLRRGVDTERLIGRLRKLVSKNRLDDAWKSWKAFEAAHGDHAAPVVSRVREILPVVTPVKRTALFPEEEARLVQRELDEPARLLVEAGIEATITVYGSARTPEGSPAYEEARRFGELVARYGGGKIAIVSGGGGGIMAAANRGAFEAGGPSIGYNIKLPHEQRPNPYVTPGLSYTFEYFHTRKLSMRRPAMALTYFEGGFGTLDELFEVLTLMQTGKMARVPIVLVGRKEYWDKVIDFEHLVAAKLISPNDLTLFSYAEDAEGAWSVIAASQAKK